jgi:nucleoside-diphosphate-sugar epimerase
MKVAVTRASGSIGSYVIRELLEHGHEPVGVGPRQSALDVPVRVAQLGDQDALASSFEGAEAVIHLAAITNPYRASIHEVLDVNVGYLDFLPPAGPRR